MIYLDIFSDAAFSAQRQPKLWARSPGQGVQRGATLRTAHGQDVVTRALGNVTSFHLIRSPYIKHLLDGPKYVQIPMKNDTKLYKTLASDGFWGSVEYWGKVEATFHEHIRGLMRI